MTIDQKIEAILFFKAEPIGIAELSRILGASESDIKAGIALLEEKLVGRGVALLHKDGEIMLGTVPEAGRLIEGIIKEELSKELGRAGLETLSIVLYRGPISRSKIDHIRGVNSNFIVRNLLVRGLIERIPNPGDQRSFLYRPTFELLAYLGLSSVEKLPEYEVVRKEIEMFEAHAEAGTQQGERKEVGDAPAPTEEERIDARADDAIAKEYEEDTYGEQ